MDPKSKISKYAPKGWKTESLKVNKHVFLAGVKSRGLFRPNPMKAVQKTLDTKKSGFCERMLIFRVEFDFRLFFVSVF